MARGHGALLQANPGPPLPEMPPEETILLHAQVTPMSPGDFIKLESLGAKSENQGKRKPTNAHQLVMDKTRHPRLRGYYSAGKNGEELTHDES